jgi:hypothetical protein
MVTNSLGDAIEGRPTPKELDDLLQHPPRPLLAKSVEFVLHFHYLFFNVDGRDGAGGVTKCK